MRDARVGENAPALQKPDNHGKMDRTQKVIYDAS